MKRVLRFGVLALVWFGSTVLGASAAALRTDAGRRVVVQSVRSAVSNAIQGSLHTDSVGGTFWSGLEVWNAQIIGTDGVPFVTVPHLRLNYSLGTLLSRRFVLGELTIENLVVNLIQVERGGPFNVDIIFAGDTMATVVGEPANPYLAFRDVRIIDATLTIRTPADADDSGVVEGERRETGYYRVRRIEELNAFFPYVRLLSPVPGEDPITIDIASLAAVVNDPGFQLVGASGSAEVWSDSVTFDLDAVALPETEGQASGTLFWPTGPLQFNLQVDAERIFTTDLAGLVREIPRGLDGNAHVTIRSLSEDVLVMDAEMQLSGRGGGGSVVGHLGMQFGPGDMWSQRQTNLTLQRFDLEYVRGLLDTLPVAGRVTGLVVADGRRDSLTLNVDATFRDSLVPDWPETYIRSSGVVSLGVPGDFVFHAYELDTADISLPTVHRLIPAVQLVGHLRGSGVLDGPWLEVTYQGRLRHRDGGSAETVAEGTIRLDATGNVVGVWGELAFDSLRLEGLQTSYPQLTATATLAGLLTIGGYLDSILIDARLDGPAGALRLRGPFVFDGDRSGAHAFEIVVSGLDASAFYPGLGPTSLNGRVTGRGWQGDSGQSVLETRLELGGSDLRGVVFDTIFGGLSLRDSLIVVDSIEAWKGGSVVKATGALGIAQPRRDRVRYSIDLDDVAAVEPWIAKLIGSLDADAPAPSGRLRVSGELNGAADAFVVVADIQVSNLNRGNLHFAQFGGSGTWASASKAIRVTGAVDSLQAGPALFNGLSFTVQGRPDSLQWRARSRFQRRTTLIGSGQWVVDSASMRFDIDSLRASLHAGHWSADSFSITLTDSAALFERVVIVDDSGAGRAQLEGRLPFVGEGTLDGSVEALAIADVWALLGLNPENVSGRISGTLRQAGTARDPVIEVAIGVVDGQFGGFAAPQVSGELGYRDRRVTGDLNLYRRGAPILQIEVDVPYDLGVGSIGQRRGPGLLSITARADSVDLSFFDAINPAVRDVVGTFDADVGITGTWERPTLTGAMSVANGAASFPSLGVRHEGLNGRLEFAGDTIHIRALSMRSGVGTASVGGFVRLEELSKPVLGLTVSTVDFDALNVPGFVSLTTTGTIDLDGPVFNATMTGSVTATRGVVYFADLITKDVVNLEDSIFLGLVDTTLLQDEGLGAAFENRFLDSLRIDSLDVSIGSAVWLRSGEANIQLTGAVNIDKERDVYRINGELLTPRGTYRLEVFPTVAREFTVTRGAVRYFGTTDLNAGLDIDARHVVRGRGRGEDVDIFINIGGTLFEPELTLTSNLNPPLSDDEIMSFLLFGGAALDAGQMQVAEFASERLSQVVSGQLENFVISNMDVPLDYFQIRPASRGGLLAGEVSFGKQFDVLGQSAFLTATPRYCPRLTTQQFDIGASLEFRFSRRWLLEASVEPRRSCDSFTSRTAGALDRQFGLDLIWELRY